MPSIAIIRSWGTKTFEPRKNVKKRIKKTIREVFKFPAVVIYFVPSILVYLTRVRFVIISHPGRIGHLATELDCFLKEIALGDRPQTRAVLLASHVRIANQCLLKYWAERVHVIRNRLAGAVLRPFLHFPYLRIDLVQSIAAVNESATYHSVLARWGSRPPQLCLSDSDRRQGEACLKQMGVPEGSWFVAVHSRESGYDAPKHQYAQDYRNSDIQSYRLAMEEVIDRGGWCLRVGDPTMKPQESFPGFIDYANSRFKNDWMDIFLCARGRFFLGNTSGLCVVSNLFGVPAAQANLIPYGACLPPDPANISTPKLLRNQSGEFIKFPEVFGSPIAQFWDSKNYEQHSLTVIDNTPEEIRDMTIEMLDRLNNVAIYTEEDENLQISFRKLFRPGHYSFGSAARLGREFTRKYSDLIST